MTADEADQNGQELNRFDWLYGLGSLPIILAIVQLLRSGQAAVAVLLYLGACLIFYARSAQETHRSSPKTLLAVFAGVAGINVVLQLVIAAS